jgi:glycosyltransferase involved in cell wall biosynthesis
VSELHNPTRPQQRTVLEPVGDVDQPLPGVTAIVTCYNEEHHIRACLESVLWCDEVVVVDSFSTDRTPEIVTAIPGVRFVQRTYYGGASQKNWAIGRARHEWILILDADERCTDALRDEIQSILTNGATYDAYEMRRRCYFMGRVIRFSGWRNDRVTRLFRSGHGYYENRRVHARLVTSGRDRLLDTPLEHYMVDSVDEYTRRMERYGYWGAAQCWLDGKRSGPMKILFRSLWRFLRTYIVQGGILDGTRGLVFCGLQAYATFTKWSLLWSWRRNASRGEVPKLPEFDEDPEVWSGLERIRVTDEPGARPLA